jgi:hypothetical protein
MNLKTDSFIENSIMNENIECRLHNILYLVIQLFTLLKTIEFNQINTLTVKM